MRRSKQAERKWILASASPRRKEILKNLGLIFTVDPSGIPEPDRDPHEPPSKYAIRIACLKAAEIAAKHKSGLIIGVDTIVVSGNTILGKPRTRAEARTMLQMLSGRWHEVLSGICLIDAGRSIRRVDCARSRVHFKRLSPEEIEWYLKTGEHRDKAGAYGIQGYAALFIDRIEGCYFNIVGFPITAFEKLCRKMKIDLIQELQPMADCRMRIAD